jgi:hypothetical protein
MNYLISERKNLDTDDLVELKLGDLVSLKEKFVIGKGLSLLVSIPLSKVILTGKDFNRAVLA